MTALYAHCARPTLACKMLRIWHIFCSRTPKCSSSPKNALQMLPFCPARCSKAWVRCRKRNLPFLCALKAGLCSTRLRLHHLDENISSFLKSHPQTDKFSFVALARTKLTKLPTYTHSICLAQNASVQKFNMCMCPHMHTSRECLMGFLHAYLVGDGPLLYTALPCKRDMHD